MKKRVFDIPSYLCTKCRGAGRGLRARWPFLGICKGCGGTGLAFDQARLNGHRRPPSNFDVRIVADEWLGARLAKLREYVELNGAVHDDGCPGDETCQCSKQQINEAVNDLCQMKIK